MFRRKTGADVGNYVKGSRLQGSLCRRHERYHWSHYRRPGSVQSVYRCLHNMAPGYLSTLYQPVCPALLHGRRHLYARLVVVNWTSHVSIWIRTGHGRLPMPVPHLGTLYLTVSRTLILFCKPSNAISRPFFFPTY